VWCSLLDADSLLWKCGCGKNGGDGGGAICVLGLLVVFAQCSNEERLY
jgi:hypothetical protein